LNQIFRNYLVPWLVKQDNTGFKSKARAASQIIFSNGGVDIAGPAGPGRTCNSATVTAVGLEQLLFFFFLLLQLTYTKTCILCMFLTNYKMF